MTETQILTGEAPGVGRTTSRHPLSIGHLVMGVAFAGLTVVWALVAGDIVEGEDVRYLLPAPWVLAGAAGLLALVVTDRRRHGARATGWVGLEQAPPEPEPEPEHEPEPEPAGEPEDAPEDRRGTMGS